MVETAAIKTGGAITLRGHSDSKGNDGDNRVASRVRAEAVEAYLVEKGIAKDRITLIALGETRYRRSPMRGRMAATIRKVVRRIAGSTSMSRCPWSSCRRRPCCPASRRWTARTNHSLGRRSGVGDADDLSCLAPLHPARPQ
ncbi:OmpA family protein [Sphingobium scionense]